MQISERLKTVASFVKGYRVADIGTDHAYVPIYLMKQGKILQALAMDIGKGPLERATEHIREQGLQSRIQTRLSDGLAAYRSGEADSIVIAGMGGALIVKILSEGAGKYEGVKELVLSPQSEIYLVRQWLRGHGWKIEEETMLIEDGKYYTIMRAVRGINETAKLVEDYYGKYLLEHKWPVLKQFLLKEKQNLHGILANLQSGQGEHIKNREQELRDKLLLIEEALAYYEM